MQRCNDGVPLHIHAEKPVHAKLVKLPQGRHGDGHQNGKEDAQSPVILILFVQQHRDVAAHQGEGHAAAQVEHLVPMGHQVIQLINASGHRRQQVKQGEHEQRPAHAIAQPLQHPGHSRPCAYQQAHQRIAHRLQAHTPQQREQHEPLARGP